MKKLRICILGGTGFIGSHLAPRLTGLGHAVSVITRRPERHRGVRVGTGVQLVQADPYDADALREAFAGTDCIINLAGILNEMGNSRFQRVHVELPRTMVKTMRETGIKRLLHISALNANVNESHSQYLKTKGEGENLVHQAPGLDVTSFRPSVVFGPGDSFFNRFATLLRLSPLVFPLACASTRFAPVYVGDLVDAFCNALEDDNTIGKRLDLCGPETCTLAQLVEYTAGQIGLKTRIPPLPDFLARLQARMLSLVPGKPFSLDNYYSLQQDSVCNESGFAALGIVPTGIETVVPAYLGQQSRRGSYNSFRKSARR